MSDMGVADLLLSGAVGTEEFDAAVDAADPSDIAAVIALANHESPVVRRSVASTLPLLSHGDPPNEEMVEVAVRLTTDVDKQVRDHACFALAEQWREVDTPEVREALAVRLDDIDHDARSEALVGLAYRRDERASRRVRDALSRPSGNVSRLEMIAAGALSEPGLHDLVQRHRFGWRSADGATTAEVVSRLTDPAGPGDDVLEGVAQLYRRRAHGHPDGDAVAAWHLMNEMLDIAPHRAPGFLDAVLDRLADDKAAHREARERSALAQLATEVS